MKRTRQLKLSRLRTIRVVEAAPDVLDRLVPILCADDEKRIVYGVVYEPLEVDTHGDYMTAEDIEAACHGFMKSQVIGVQHEGRAPAELVENYIAQSDQTIGGQAVKKGSWIMAAHILDDDLWAEVKAGTYGGLSLGGYASKEPDPA